MAGLKQYASRLRAVRRAVDGRLGGEVAQLCFVVCEDDAPQMVEAYLGTVRARLPGVQLVVIEVLGQRQPGTQLEPINSFPQRWAAVFAEAETRAAAGCRPTSGELDLVPAPPNAPRSAPHRT